MASKKYGESNKGGFATGNNPSIGRNDVAGLPKECVQTTYPKSKNYRGGYLDDTMNDIDRIDSGSEGMVTRNPSNQK